MKKNIPDIDKIFKDALGDFHEAAPPAVWESLNNDLDRKQAAHFREKYYRLRKLALLLLLLVFSGGIYLVYKSKETKKEIIAVSTVPAFSVQTNEATQTAAAKTNTIVPAAEQRQVSKDAVSIENKISAGEVVSTNATSKKIGQTTNSSKAEHGDLSRKHVQQLMAAGSASAKQPPGIAAEILPADKSTTAKNSKNKPSNADNMPASSIHGKRQTVEQYGTIKNNKANTNTREWNISGNQQNNTAAAESRRIKSVTNKFSLQQENDKKTADQAVRDLSAYMYIPALEAPVFADLTIVPFISAYPLEIYDSIGKAERQVVAAAAKKKAELQHRFSLVAFGAPNHSFTRLENDQQLSGPGRDKKEAERSEKQASSFSAGLLMNYSLGKHVMVQSGIVFSSATTNIAGKTIYAKPDNAGHNRYEFNCSSGYSYIMPKSGIAPATGDSIQVMGSSSTISYIGVPVSINYAIRAGRFLLVPGAGFSLNFLTSGSAATHFGNSNFGSQKEKAPIDGLKTAYLDGFFGVGIEYMLSKRISLEMRPLMRLALTSINKNTPVRAYQNFSSVEAGLKFNF